jgi:hypothetical protein
MATQTDQLSHNLFHTNPTYSFSGGFNSTGTAAHLSMAVNLLAPVSDQTQSVHPGSATDHCTNTNTNLTEIGIARDTMANADKLYNSGATFD